MRKGQYRLSRIKDELLPDTTPLDTLTKPQQLFSITDKTPLFSFPGMIILLIKITHTYNYLCIIV